MKYQVIITTDDKKELPENWPDGWNYVRAKSHRDAAISLLRSCFKLYQPFGKVWIWVSGENDPKHPNGKPIFLQSFILQW